MRCRSSLLISALLVASGCTRSFTLGPPAIRGSGVAKDEIRAIEAFHALDAQNAIEVTLTVAPGSKPSLKVSGDDNLVALVESDVKDGKLTLRIKENTNVWPKRSLLAEVVTDQLDSVHASGAANVKVTGETKADEFTADASGEARISVASVQARKAVAAAAGASQVSIAGTAESLKTEASGASHVKAADLKVSDADVSINGASNAELHTSKSVTGDVSGASRLNVHGKPAHKNVSVSGASSVNDKD